MQIGLLYKTAVRNDWCSEKCDFNKSCAPALAHAFRCGGYELFKNVEGSVICLYGERDRSRGGCRPGRQRKVEAAL